LEVFKANDAFCDFEVIDFLVIGFFFYEADKSFNSLLLYFLLDNIFSWIWLLATELKHQTSLISLSLIREDLIFNLEELLVQALPHANSDDRTNANADE
jgi:hypothetical protein